MTAEQIVRELAANQPTVDSGDAWHQCGLCQKSLPVDEEDHRADCLWRRAREWVREADLT